MGQKAKNNKVVKEAMQELDKENVSGFLTEVAKLFLSHGLIFPVKDIRKLSIEEREHIKTKLYGKG